MNNLKIIFKTNLVAEWLHIEHLHNVTDIELIESDLHESCNLVGFTYKYKERELYTTTRANTIDRIETLDGVTIFENGDFTDDIYSVAY